MKNYISIFEADSQIGCIVTDKVTRLDSYVNDKKFRSKDCQYSLRKSSKIRDKLLFYDYGNDSVGVFSILSGDVLLLEILDDFEYLGEYDRNRWVYVTTDYIKLVSYSGDIEVKKKSNKGTIIMMDAIFSVWQIGKKYVFYSNNKVLELKKTESVALIKRFGDFIYFAEYHGFLSILDINLLEVKHEYCPANHGQIQDALIIGNELIVSYYYFDEGTISYVDRFNLINSDKATSLIKCSGDVIISNDGTKLFYEIGDIYSSFTGEKLGHYK